MENSFKIKEKSKKILFHIYDLKIFQKVYCKEAHIEYMIQKLLFRHKMAKVTGGYSRKATSLRMGKGVPVVAKWKPI